MSKPITDIEIKTGIVARDAKDLPKTTHEQEYIEYALQFLGSGEFVGVNYPDRVEFLETNGYELTRENLVDASLSVKQEK